MSANNFLTVALVTSVLTATPVAAQPPKPIRPASPVLPAPPPEPIAPLLEMPGVSPLLVPPAPLPPMSLIPPMPLVPGEGFGGERSYALADLPRFETPGAEHFGLYQERSDARRQSAEREREGRTYDEGMRHVYDSRWERAIERFNDVLGMKGTRTDAALYWKAYSQDRLGQRTEALATLGILMKEHGNSRYVQQAKALEAEVRRNAGQPVRPQDQADEELKLMALAALQHQAPEQAVPMLENLLAGTASPRLKGQALFVLAQSDSPRAIEVLKGVAKGNSAPELQARAISYLGAHGRPESRAILSEVYTSTTDIDMKKRVLRAFMTSGDKDRVFAAAQNEQNPELRATAVQQLGAMDAHNELWQLYGKESTVEIKRTIIQAMHAAGNTTRMMEIARTEQNPELRRSAIRGLGAMDGKQAPTLLFELYAKETDAAVKRTIIGSLASGDHAEQLVAIARKETDPKLKMEIVQRLSHIKSKVATDYLLEILNK